MADSSEQNNPPQFEEEQEEEQMENTVDDDDSDEEDEQQEEEDDHDEEDSYSEEEEEDDDDDDDDEEDEEEEYMNSAPAMMSPRVSVNSVGAVAEQLNSCGEGGKVPAAGFEVGEVDGLICPICMSPWTNGGDHQLCCLSCGHLYGLSCIKRWVERCKGSAKCPQCNQKCKPKDVRVIYASRVVVADEESKEKIQGLEAKMALLEKMIKRFGFHEGYEVVHQELAAIRQKLDVIHQDQRTFQQKQLEFQQKQLEFQQEQRTFWQERERIDKQRYEEHCTFWQEQRTFRQELAQYMQQQTGNSSQPWTPPLPLGPTQ